MNTYIHTYTHTYIHTYIHTPFMLPSYYWVHRLYTNTHIWCIHAYLKSNYFDKDLILSFNLTQLSKTRLWVWPWEIIYFTRDSVKRLQNAKTFFTLTRRFFTLCSAVEGIRCLSTLKTLCASALSKKAARPGVFNRGTLCAEDPCLARLECKGTSRKLQDPLSRLECLYAKRHSMHVCALYMYVDIYAHTYMYSMYLCTRIQINKYWYIYTRTSTFICVCICTFVSDLYLDLSETW